MCFSSWASRPDLIAPENLLVSQAGGMIPKVTCCLSAIKDGHWAATTVQPGDDCWAPLLARVERMIEYD